MFSDSVVAGSANSAGLAVSARDTSKLRITNVTVTGHATTGIGGEFDPGATASLYNGILFGNGTDLHVADIESGSNLVGVDPLFAGPGDFTPGAPAFDQGDPCSFAANGLRA